MSSPSKRVDLQKDSTMFGQLTNIQKQTILLNKQIIQQLDMINKLKNQLNEIQKQGKQSCIQSKNKLNDQTKKFQQKIKSFLISQKAQYMRLSNQINSMIQNSKDISSQLALLGTKFDELKKNVGI